MSAKVLMLASGKGGTGKSTVSVLLGAKLAARGKSVLLVELDSGLRSVDIISGVYGKTVYDVEDILSGRCRADKAVAESLLYPNLSVISAPYSGGTVQTEPLSAFLAQVCREFDFILLDTAAGMGAPFEAAAAVAQLALIVITPDPVTVRDGRIVSDALYEHPYLTVRLLLNKVPQTLAGSGVDNLDFCIDTVGAQLIGVLPYSEQVKTAGATGTKLPQNCKADRAFAAVAARICGREAPLVIT
ncbi:MAG: AAA family ATPase [Ruthenibacterium sp.]